MAHLGMLLEQPGQVLPAQLDACGVRHMVDMARGRHLLVPLDEPMDDERMYDHRQDRLASVEAGASHMGHWLQEQR